MATKPQLAISRINTIMKSSSDVDFVSKESSLLMCRAAEMFLKNLATESNNKITGKTLDYKHLADVIHEDDRYNFLRDIMPKKITVLEARKLMAKRQALENGASSEDSSSSSSDCSSSTDNEDNNSTSDDFERNYE